ncbi:alpha/beta hydrolase [Labilithrix luteola]|uniref:alpha/beta hydrolase n=1 Tax=Labilithrix luteola TaxID=1391654 RepID=UPI001475A3E4|nr:alpha/beta hydrolase [Labilithrix luteola]
MVEPKSLELDLRAQREVGEHHEDRTSEPEHVVFEPAPEVDGLWAIPTLLEQREPPRSGLYLHGGGYITGSPAARRKTAGHIAHATSARVLVPSYRLAPEHRFPAAVQDALHAYELLLSRDARSERTFIAGDSSGGGLAVATLLAAQQANVPLPAACVVISPWADLLCSGESMTRRAKADVIVARENLLHMAEQYLGAQDAHEPLASPVFAKLDGLCPLLALVGGDEIVRDDAARLVCGFSAGGADATLFVGGGMQHIWPTWVGALPEADEAMAMVGAWVRAHTGALRTV